MSRKTVSFAAKPQQPATADDWVSGRPEPAPLLPPQQQPDKAEPMKRLTIDVSESLHKRIKVQCALRGEKIADVVRTLLEGHFAEEGSSANGHKIAKS
jgi:hypothetical protein